jgi:hypothetical protein
MMEPTENRSGHDAALGRQPMPGARGHGQANGGLGEAWSEGGMRAAAVVVDHPLFQDPSEVVLRQRNEEVQALPPDRPDEPLAEGVGLRGPDWGAQDADPHRPQGGPAHGVA